MPTIDLRLKVSLILICLLSTAMVIFTLLFFYHRQEDLQLVISSHVTQIAETIVSSTRYTMMENKRDVAENIIKDIARQKGIERVRVISKDGTIIHSNRQAEVGYSVEQNEAPCVHCHLTSTPLKQVPDDKRWNITQDASGHRVIGTMKVIRNEASCSSASCHEHKAGQTVLGIVDLAYSLDEIDASMRSHLIHFVGISFGFILIFSLGVAYMLKRLVYVPLSELEVGTIVVSAGGLEHQLPVRSGDEFGRVANAFNEMTKALGSSRQAMQDLVRTLEDRVKNRTAELLSARAEVAQGEKLASIGVLASGIAHELNNPLTGVLTFTSLLRKKAKDGSEDAEDLDLVIGETKRCASIIKRLLDFAREKTPVKGFCDINQVIEDTVRFVERPASLQQIDIKTHLNLQLPHVWCDADLIKQVIMNLLVNAQQAIEGKGSITVSTCASEAAKTAINSSPDAGPAVDISVTDTGCGIAQANLGRIFDPFFTSKEVGKGTGLGLSVSYGIVQAHGGRISVQSTVGEGTTFHVFLPVAPANNGTERPMAESPK
jgi:two-component system NtrC family sensor kinase